MLFDEGGDFAEYLAKCVHQDVNACAAAEIEPMIAMIAMIAMGRETNNLSLDERFPKELPPPPLEPATPPEAMGYRLKTPLGKKCYALRKHTPESVFDIIKRVLGFRQFLLRGINKVRGEWSLVTMA